MERKRRPLQTDYDDAPAGFDGQVADNSNYNPFTLATRGVPIRMGALCVKGDLEGTVMLPDSAGVVQAAPTGLVFAGMVVRHQGYNPCCDSGLAAPVATENHAVLQAECPASMAADGRFKVCVPVAVTYQQPVFMRHAITAPEQFLGEATNIDDASTQAVPGAVFMKDAAAGEVSWIEFATARGSV